jgi:hypothetical protein
VYLVGIIRKVYVDCRIIFNSSCSLAQNTTQICDVSVYLIDLLDLAIAHIHIYSKSQLILKIAPENSSQSEIKSKIHIFQFLIFSSNQNSSGLIVLPFHYSSPQKLPQLRHLPYHGMMSFSLSVECSPCPMLSTIVSQLFLPHSHLQICGHQEFASVLETDDNSLAPDMSSMQMFQGASDINLYAT